MRHHFLYTLTLWILLIVAILAATYLGFSLLITYSLLSTGFFLVTILIIVGISHLLTS